MIRLTFLLLLLLHTSVFAQTWQQFTPDQFDNGIFIAGYDVYEEFQINPSDNSLWLCRADQLIHINDNGSHETFNAFNTSYILGGFFIRDVAFTSSAAYFMDESYGIHKYEGGNWTHVFVDSDCQDIASENDTVWIARQNSTLVQLANDTPLIITNDVNRRILRKKGMLWGSNKESNWDARTVVYNNEDGSYDAYYGSNSNMMDSYSYDYKVANNSTALYVAGRKGLSIAVDQFFYDSICAENSTNMPSGYIIEFEFDSQDNIWAIFGGDDYMPTHVAHYNQLTEDWDQVYDASNSIINFDARLDIEIDTNDNVWLARDFYLYFLKVQEEPHWTGLKEQIKEFSIKVHPNPVASTLHVTGLVEQSPYQLVSLTGQVVKEGIVFKTIDVASIESGVYNLKIGTQPAQTVKIVVE